MRLDIGDRIFDHRDDVFAIAHIGLDQRYLHQLEVAVGQGHRRRLKRFIGVEFLAQRPDGEIFVEVPLIKPMILQGFDYGLARFTPRQLKRELQRTGALLFAADFVMKDGESSAQHGAGRQDVSRKAKLNIQRFQIDGVIAEIVKRFEDARWLAGDG